MSANLHDVTEVAVESRLLAGVRARVPFGRVGEFVHPNLDQVYAAAASGAIHLDGQNIFVYHPNPQGDLTVDFCVGAKSPFASVGAVTQFELPSGIAATTTLWGAYTGIRAATDAVLQYCRTNNRPHTGISWEIYGHWNDDPAKLRTDIYFLLKE